MSGLLLLKFLLMEESRVDNRGNDIVEGMSAGCNAKTTNDKKNRKVNARDRPEAKLQPVKWYTYVMVCAEQPC